MIRKLIALLMCMLLTLLIPQSAFAVSVPGSSDRQFTYREDNIEGNHYDFVNSVNRSFFRKASDGYMRLYGADNGELEVSDATQIQRYLTTMADVPYAIGSIRG